MITWLRVLLCSDCASSKWRDDGICNRKLRPFIQALPRSEYFYSRQQRGFSLSLFRTQKEEFKDKPVAKRGRHGRSAMLGPNEVIHNWIMEKKKQLPFSGRETSRVVLLSGHFCYTAATFLIPHNLFSRQKKVRAARKKNQGEEQKKLLLLQMK